MSVAARPFAQAIRPLSRAAVRVGGGLAARSSRAFVTARPTVPRVRPALTQVRGVKTIDFAGTKETVYGELQLPRRRLLEAPG